jgi:hypothetical protein
MEMGIGGHRGHGRFQIAGKLRVHMLFEGIEHLVF